MLCRKNSVCAVVILILSLFGKSALAIDKSDEEPVAQDNYSLAYDVYQLISGNWFDFNIDLDLRSLFLQQRFENYNGDRN